MLQRCARCLLRTLSKESYSSDYDEGRALRAVDVIALPMADTPCEVPWRFWLSFDHLYCQRSPTPGPRTLPASPGTRQMLARAPAQLARSNRRRTAGRG